MHQTLSALLRKRDPDRYFTTLFAPAKRRDILVTLYAFNHELARATEAAREPGLALIRLQWWREVVEGASRAHEVATPLRAALSAGHLQAGDLLAMIEAREQEAEAEMPTLATWRDWLLLGAGSLAVAAGRALGAEPPALERLSKLGAGYGAAGQRRNVAAFARQGRCLLPAELLARHGLTPGAVIAGPASPRLGPVHAALSAEGRAMLGAPQHCRRDWLAAGLPAVLARRDLRRNAPVRLVTDQLALTVSALRSVC